MSTQLSKFIFSASAGIVMLPATLALAQDTGTPEPAAAHWTVRAEPAAWFLGPAGSLRLPTFASGATTPADSEDTFDLSDLQIDTPEASPFAEIHLSKKDWRFSLRGVSMSGEEDFFAAEPGNVGDFDFEVGDQIRTELKYSQFEVEAAYLLKSAALEPYESGHKLHSKVELIGGVRVYDVEWDVTNLDGGARAADDVMFVEPLAGSKLSLTFYEKFDADLQVVIGGLPAGDTSSLSIDVIVGGAYRFNEHFGLQLGYRLTGFDLENDDSNGEFDWRGSVAGLYVGAVLEF